MGRAPLNSPESVRAIVQQLLDGAGVAAPVTPLLFRRVVSTRRVRELLGGGDPSWISRQIRAVEAQVISESHARFVTDGLPETLAESMRSLWKNALEAAQAEFDAARAAADEAIASAISERDNADALTAMLRIELEDCRRQASGRDTRIGHLEAELAASQRQLAEEKERTRTAEARLAEVSRARDNERQKHNEAVGAIQREYAGLSRQLLNSTDEQRQALAAAQAAVAPELKSLRQRLAHMSTECERLKRNLASAAAPEAFSGASPSADNPAGRPR